MPRHAAAPPTGPIRWVGGVVLWTVILGFSAAITAMVLVPRVAGATPFTILTGSMKPTMPPGTLVIVKPVSPEEIGVGTAITYQLKSGEPTVVTHRVVSAGINGKGEHVFRTQGDANEVVDEAAVKPEQVRGKVWYSVPHLGYVSALITGDQRRIATLGITGALGLYALSTFASALRGRRNRTSVRSSSTPSREHAHG